jgi:hypothetical protein
MYPAIIGKSKKISFFFGFNKAQVSNKKNNQKV